MARVGATVAGQQFLNAWAAPQDHSHAPPDPDRWSRYRPQFFSQEDFQTLDRFTDILIPTDDTPGAREAHVAAFIDFVVFSAAEFAPETQGQWRQALDVLRQNGFAAASADGQVSIVKAMSEQRDAGLATFRTIKDLAVYAFYTSRAGMIDNLQYKGLAYLTEFPGCSHPEHWAV